VIRILAVDDHAIVRDGISRLIARQSDKELVAEAREYRVVTRIARPERWDRGESWALFSQEELAGATERTPHFPAEADEKRRIRFPVPARLQTARAAVRSRSQRLLPKS